MTLSTHRLDSGRFFHSSRVSSRDSERYMSSTSRIRATKVAARAHHRHLEVEVERSDVHVAGADHGGVVVHREVLGVEDERSGYR